VGSFGADMALIKAVIIGFVLLEATNVIALYFFPDSKLANSVGIFNAWEKSKSDAEMLNFAAYLVNWVAGSKLIFLLLLVVIVLTGSDQTLIFTGAVMAVATASFFWRLFPLVRKMDRAGEIEPPRYSAVLGWMILAFVLIFLAATFISGWL